MQVILIVEPISINKSGPPKIVVRGSSFIEADIRVRAYYTEMNVNARCVYYFVPQCIHFIHLVDKRQPNDTKFTENESDRKKRKRCET